MWVNAVAQMVKNLPAVQKTWVWSLSGEDPLEKEMTTHSSILAGEFHGQRSLVGYSPWGGKRIRHNWATNTHTQLQNSLAFPSLPPAIGLFAENVLFFTILFLLRIYLSRDIQKNYCLLKMLKIVPLWWKCMLPVDFILLLIFRNCFFKFSFSFIII